VSGQPLWLRDLIAYSIQIAALVGAAAILANVLRVRAPKVRLAYWQALLALCLFLPLLEPWQREVLQAPTVFRGAAAPSIAVTPAPSGTGLGPVVTRAPFGIPLAEIVSFAICAGIVFRVFWMGLGLTRLWMYRRRAQRPAEPVPAVTEARRLAPVSTSIFISDKIRIPATFGFFRPVILFPERFLEMDPSAQKPIALHELLHVERRDWLWNVLEELILTLLWFEVPLWWVIRCARLSREAVVDAEAIRRSNARGPYVRALLAMAGQKQLAEYLPAALFLRENQLAERVALMMKEVNMSRARLTAFVVTASAALLIAGTLLAYAFPLKAGVQQAASSAAPRPAAVAESGAGAQSRTHGNSAPADVMPAQNNTKAGQPAQTPQAAPEPRPAPQPLKSGAAQLNQTEIQRKIQQAMRKAEAARVNQAQIQKKIADALKKGEAAQQVTSRIDQAKIQQRVDEALKRAQIDQKIAAKIDRAQIQRQIDQAMKRAGNSGQKIAASIASAEIQQQVEQAISQAVAQATQQVTSRIGAGVQTQVQQATQRAMNHGATARDQARKRLQAAREQLRKQLQAARAASRVDQQASKVDRAEIQREIDQAQRRLQAATKEAERARENLYRLEMEKLRSELPPPASPSHSPAPQVAPNHP
jgi:beta-lactamase regulating signal transducer with metallopeptidase domain